MDEGRGHRRRKTNEDARPDPVRSCKLSVYPFQYRFETRLISVFQRPGHVLNFDIAPAGRRIPKNEGAVGANRSR